MAITGYIQQEHHYVPRGYFRPWEQGDRKVVVYERIDGKIIGPYLQSTKKICVKPGLYAYTESVIPEQRNVLEEKMFQRIDSKAARVLTILNNCDSVQEVSDRDMHAFMLFLVSLRVRTPEFFEQNAQSTERRLRKLIIDAENDPAVAASRESDIDKYARYDKRRFVEQVNIGTVSQAKSKAFAADRGHALRFFERRLGVFHSSLPFSTLVDPELLDRRINEAAYEEMVSRRINFR
jgi:hypothetical protein